jgi:predicted HicB family RNase H-like nuclease
MTTRKPTHGGRRQGAGRKPAASGERTLHLHVRVDGARLEAYQRAAKSSEATLTGWVLETLDAAVKPK